MSDQSLSRRRVLALAGSSLTATAAGCFDAAPETTAPAAENTTESPPESPDEPPTTGSPGEFPDDPEAPPQDRDEPPADSEYAAVFQNAVDSVVGVRVRSGDETGVGTAWVYEDEYLVTNEHVVADDERPYVWFGDVGWRESSVVGTDVFSDLAVLQVANKPDNSPALPLVDDAPPVGTEVVAIGNPFDLTGSFTTGVISGRNRNIPDPDRPFSIADGVQTDAALNPGNSGGPVLTLDGEVAGVVRSGVGQNIGFAISAAMTSRVVPALIEDGEYDHSFIGVALEDVTPELIRANGLSVTWGAYVDQVLADYPAASVLQGSTGTTTVHGQEIPVGGDVIVRIGDWTIETSERLSAYLALETSPGNVVEMEIVRDGRRQVVSVPLVARDQSM